MQHIQNHFALTGQLEWKDIKQHYDLIFQTPLCKNLLFFSINLKFWMQ